MDLGTAIVGSTCVTICALPFVLTGINRKKNEMQLVATLKNTAKKNASEISQYEICGNYAIGIDNGIVFHSISAKTGASLKNAPTVKLMEFISSTDTINAPIDINNELKVPHNNNFLKIKVALPNVPLSNSRQPVVGSTGKGRLVTGLLVVRPRRNQFSSSAPS